MVTLKLEKGFGKRLASEEFMKNKKKELTLHLITDSNEHTKKVFDDSETKVIKNVKKIKKATYGKGDSKLDVTDKIDDILKVEIAVDILNKVNKDLMDFFLVFMNVLCPRCYNSTKKNMSGSLSDSTSKNLHNCGYINFLMKSTHPNYLQYLFDGIIKCFLAYLIGKNKVKRWIEVFTHILLSIQGNKCPSDIYTASQEIHAYYISGGERNGPHISSDAIKHCDNSSKDKLNIFYAHIYPALKYFYLNQRQVFIRHGLEKNTGDYRNPMVYPHNDVNHGWRIHKITGIDGKNRPTVFPAYAIEIDNYPFKKCSLHSSKEIYGCVKGYITQNDYKKYGGIIHFRYENNNTVMSRDHLFGESEIGLDKWVFTYKTKSPEHLKKEIKAAVKSLMQANSAILAEDYLENFSIISELILNKFIILH